MTAGLTANPMSGAFIMNIDRLTDGQFAFDISALNEWLDGMQIDKRIMVTHFARFSDEVIAWWLAHGFDVVIADADNDNAPGTVLAKVKGAYRVFVASSPSDLIEYYRHIDAPVFVACPRSPGQPVIDEVKQRSTATWWMERFLYPLPPAINIAA
jgi:hypothetical protein